MRNYLESASVAAVNRVSAVGRADAADLPPIVRGTEGLQDGLPRPRAALLPADDVALFERLVFGDAPRFQAAGGARAMAPTPTALPETLQPGDRIASTLRHLAQVRGL
ncbi:MAG: hypothetical protein RJA69_87 [Pseudomonadota bacterium]|jgi:hypothetical protein